MGQVVRQLRRRGVALIGADFQAAQDGFLQPGWQIGSERARRDRVDPEPPPHGAARERRTEGQSARRQPVGDDAEGEDIAARIGADARQLFGRDGRAGAGRQAEFLLHEIGQLGVVRQAEIDQHGRAVVAEKHVLRLQVEVNEILPMQVVHRRRDRCDEAHGLVRDERRARAGFGQAGAFDALHDEPGRAVDVADGDQARHVRPLQAAENHALDLEADQAARMAAEAEAGDFHEERERSRGAVGGLDVVEQGHAALVQQAADAEAAHFRAVRKRAFPQVHSPAISRHASRSGSPASRILPAAAWTSYGTRKWVSVPAAASCRA
ncbi:MAG: hypothetical protein EFKGCFLK_00856 [Rhodocyclaceae bacterium]|nr:hypothetical protein [Rhodocyclaceae bacterium]